MSRLPFDPDRVASPQPASGAPGVAGVQTDRPLTVSEVGALIRDALADRTPGTLRVVGQVSNFSDRSHWFFSIKDEQTTLRCVCFASKARRAKAPVADGMQVVVTGRLDFYDAQGHVQLYVDKIEPVGQGALELQFRQLCDELRQAGYFDPARKRPLPGVSRRIAVVTSRSAAALGDVIDTAHRRWPGCELLLYDVRVQGEQAAGEIADAIAALSEHGAALQVDAIILTRGGGSIEDLWAFNERAVADAIHQCRLPIVAAIGHETDTTIAELVADLRCATPTQAAMAVVPDAEALLIQVQQYDRRLRLLLKRQAESSRQRLDAAARHQLFRRPQAMLELAQRRTADTVQRLSRAAQHALHERRTGLQSLTRQLETLGPKSILARGYTYTLGPDGQIVRTANQVAPGDTMTTVVIDGRIQSTVDSDRPDTPTRPARRKPQATDQYNLFDAAVKP